MNHKEIRQKGAALLRKMAEKLPVNYAPTPKVDKMGNHGSDNKDYIHPANTPICNKGGSKGNPKNTDY